MTQNLVAIEENKHYRLYHYEDHGWEWSGLGVFDDYCCEHPYPTEDAARNAAVHEILRLLNS